MIFPKILLMLAVPLLAGGCALLYDGKYDNDEGWRRGTVVEVGMGTSILRPARDDCRNHATAEVVARTQYAYVSYRYDRFRQARIAAVPENVPLKVGDPVYVNRRNCTLHALDPNAPASEVLVPRWRSSDLGRK
ncbi:MAG: hypothetical protein ACK5RJ_04650 [Burkholderiales bacterium]|jgi:hypothetical protein|nr:hypothetical protein [Rhodocyclaceae bacterium]MCA3021288.1 hypothetical protein [Rhodocyclaceae bacterium]MCA3052618.1 hypothetical protein [Rhodocyclaceae bacterium]